MLKRSLVQLPLCSLDSQETLKETFLFECSQQYESTDGKAVNEKFYKILMCLVQALHVILMCDFV